MMQMKEVKFAKGNDMEFFQTLRLRVNQYFKENNVSRFADKRMKWKTAILLTSYAGIYALILSNVVQSVPLKFVMWIYMGLNLAGIGLSVMHDAAHGAYSQKKKVNQWLSNVMLIIGGSTVTWNVQHNLTHHSFTNVDGIDEDIDPGFVMRFSPHKKRYFFHRFQHLYAWFFYGVMTLTWSTEKDFRQLITYKKEGKLGNINFGKTLTRMIFAKIFFHLFTIGVPMLLLLDPWYLVLLYVVSMHFIAGLTMACVFQPAHVMPTSEYPMPNEEGNLENNWAIHQVLTTANFSPNSKILSWYVGGLNYQIEHHLFPNICHVHYAEISPIVKQTVEEFGLKYNVQPTFMQALWNHARMLRMLGNQDKLTPVRA